jgi:hypothetical protein
MYLLIRYPVGAIVEGVVLTHRKNRMRVAAAGFPDIIELKRSGQEWFTSNGQPVEFDFIMSHARQSEPLSSSRPVCATRAAGSVSI